MKKTALVLLALALLAFSLAGCAGNLPQNARDGQTSLPADSGGDGASTVSGETNEPVTLLLAAAASLEKSFSETLIPRFEELYPWITVEGAYDSSGKLQTQIEEGLEASVFMSAANTQMDALTEKGYIDPDSVVELLENQIVLIAPADSSIGIDSFERITEAGTIAIGDPESVPAGQYAREALTYLGIYDAVLAKSSLGTNVTEVLNAVAEGSADVGIVYATDAKKLSDRVKVLASAPAESLSKPVLYPVGLLSKAPAPEAAKLFVDFLQSPEALAVFEKDGFKSNVGSLSQPEGGGAIGLFGHTDFPGDGLRLHRNDFLPWSRGRLDGVRHARLPGEKCF